MLFGMSVVLLGIALAASALHRRGLAGSPSSVARTAVGGVLTAFTGFSHAAMNVTMPFNLVVIIWMVATGVLMWPRAARSRQRDHGLSFSHSASAPSSGQPMARLARRAAS